MNTLKKLVNRNRGANNFNPNNNCNNNNNSKEHKKSNKAGGNPETVYPASEKCGKRNHSTEKCYFGTNAPNTPPPRHRRLERQKKVQERANQRDSKDIV